MSTAILDRTLIENLVREAIRQQSGNGQRSNGRAATTPQLVVNVSARHAHVTQEDLEKLFGKGHQLKPFKWLYQHGFFAAEETVTVIGPRQRIIQNLRILGP